MGVFQSRPEEPTEWAGLPAEPWEPRAPAEVLPPAPGDPGGLGALSDPGVVSTGLAFSVPVEVPVADAADD